LLPIAHETAGAARTRHSLLPLIGGSGKLIAKLGRMAPRDREVVFADKLFEIRILQHLLRMRAQPQAVITGLDPIESTAILDYLDELVGPSKAMIAQGGPERRRALKICALATGLGDKAVSLVYERVLRKDALKLWVERCEAQIGGVLDALEKERVAVASPYWFGTSIGHADIAVACVLRFTGEAHPALFSAARYPALLAHAVTCEALPPFREIVQPLSPPSG